MPGRRDRRSVALDMRSSSPRRALAAMALPTALLLAAPAADAAPAALKLPVPKPGHVAVGVASASKASPLTVKGALPKGVVVTGAIRGGQAVVAVIRPAGGPASASLAKVVVAAPRARLSAPALLPSALTTKGAGLGPACRVAPSALGTVLRRSGAASLSASDVKRVGAVVAGALCGKAVDAAGHGLLVAERLVPPAGQPAAPPPAGGGVKPQPGGGGGGIQPPGGGGAGGGGGGGGGQTGPAACDNGKDDDGDGQVDHVNSGKALVDPGCLGADDATEDSEKAPPRACGLGVYLRQSAKGFGADFDSISYEACPKPIAYGIVDLSVPVASCGDARWEGAAGGSCTVSTSGNAIVTGSGGKQYDVTGEATASLCGTQAYVYAWLKDGTAWEQKVDVYDPASLCGPSSPAAECANGKDDDGDGQIDVDGGAGKPSDPGCESAGDTSESGEIVGFGAGCAAVIAFDPTGDLRTAFPMLLPYPGGSCPTVTAAWVDLADGVVIESCKQAYFGGEAGGTCHTVAGSLKSSGGSGTRWGADVRLSKDASCSLIGRMAVRLPSGEVREGGTLAALAGDDGIELCP